MQYIVEQSLEDFDAWSGAYTRLNDMKKHPAALDYIEQAINECFVNPTETDINDFIWFESDDLLKEAGYLDDDYNWIERADC